MDNFKLKNVKLMNDYGLEACWEDKQTYEGEDHWLNVTKKSSINRHPDMDNSMECLKIHLVRIFGMLGVGMYKPIEDFTEKEKKFLEDLYETIDVVGLSVSGEFDEETQKDGRGVVITGVKRVFKGGKIALNTPRIPFETDQYDYAKELKSIYLDIQNETYQYFFKRKFSQLDLFANEDGEIQGVKSDEKKVDEAAIDKKLDEDVKAFKAKKAADRKQREADRKKMGVKNPTAAERRKAAEEILKKAESK